MFDNADDPNLLKGYWPRESGGSIILTSRNTNIARYSAVLPCKMITIQVGVMTIEEASDMLTALSGDQRSRETETISASRMITQRAGCLPLSLRQISAFAYESRTSLQKLSGMFQKQENLVEVHQFKSDISAIQYQHTVATVWQHNLDELKDSTVAFLNILCLLDPDEIPERMFQISGSRIELETVQALQNEIESVTISLVDTRDKLTF